MEEYIPDSLNLFSEPALQASVDGCTVVPYKPIASLDNSREIRFSVKDSGDRYRNLGGITLNLKVKLCKSDGTNYGESDNKQPGVVNNLLHSMFDQCQVYFNGVRMTSSENYPYRSYLENLLNYGVDASRTHLECNGWALDTGNNLDLQTAPNKGFEKRKTWFENSNVVELEGRLHVDIFNTARKLLTGVNVEIVLTMKDSEFYIKESETSSTLKILDATLFVPHHDINPSVLLSHEYLLKKQPAIYPYKRTEVKTFTYSSNIDSIKNENLIVGQIPSSLLVIMVDGDAFSGKKEKNPFNLKHYSMTGFNLYVNGTAVPLSGVKTKFHSEKDSFATRAFLQLYSALGTNHSDWGNQITMDMFKHGYTVLAWDLTPDRSGEESHVSKPVYGNVRFEDKFAVNLPNSVTLISYAEYNAQFRIDENRLAVIR
ncbi:uncharacterized protein F54H12.2-like [Hetaerina americana]|uniref:uncharacterized protein F54H12.2-like n=1 Tax=Hetaerina americana TaxID=62018 RepID=UPI003A7F4BE0